jgi:hypothetical protein
VSLHARGLALTGIEFKTDRGETGESRTQSGGFRIPGMAVLWTSMKIFLRSGWVLLASF